MSLYNRDELSGECRIIQRYAFQAIVVTKVYIHLGPNTDKTASVLRSLNFFFIINYLKIIIYDTCPLSPPPPPQIFSL